VDVPVWKTLGFWSVVGSVVLAVLPALLPQRDAVYLGLLVALVGLAIGLLFEQLRRLSDLTELCVFFDTSMEFRSFVGEVRDHWRSIEDHHDRLFFGQVFAGFRSEFMLRLTYLAAGSIVIDEDSEYGFRRSPLGQVRSMQMVVAGHHSFWQTSRGKTYLASQRAAIRAGLVVERVFIVEESDLQDWHSVIQAQCLAGVQVYLVVRERLEMGIRDTHDISRGIVTDVHGDRMVVGLRHENEPSLAKGISDWETERISYDPVLVADVAASFEYLRDSKSTPIPELFPSLHDCIPTPTNRMSARRAAGTHRPASRGPLH
jgi:hypothetical protein